MTLVNRLFFSFFFFFFYFCLFAPLHATELENDDIAEFMASVHGLNQKIDSIQAAFNKSSHERLDKYRRTLEEENEPLSSFWVNLAEKFETRMEELNNTVLTKLSYLESTLNTTNAEWNRYKAKVDQVTTNNDLEDTNTKHLPGQCRLTTERRISTSYATYRFPHDDPKTVISRSIYLPSFHTVEDIALAKPTYASPRFDPHSRNFVSENAVDNDEESESRSHKLDNPWWVVDFGDERIIHKIRILPRQDPRYLERFRLVEIRLGNELHLDGNFNSNQLLHFFKGPYKGGNEFLECNFNQVVKGRYLSIQIIANQEHLQLNTVVALSEVSSQRPRHTIGIPIDIGRDYLNSDELENIDYSHEYMAK